MSAGWTCLPHAGLPARIVRPLNARGRAFQARPGNGAGTPVGTPLGSAVMAACRCPCRRALSAQVSWQGADALDGALIVAVVGQLEQLWVDGLAFHIRGGVKDSLNLGPQRFVDLHRHLARVRRRPVVDVLDAFLDPLVSADAVSHLRRLVVHVAPAEPARVDHPAALIVAAAAAALVVLREHNVAEATSDNLGARRHVQRVDAAAVLVAAAVLAVYHLDAVSSVVPPFARRGALEQDDARLVELDAEERRPHRLWIRPELGRDLADRCIGSVASRSPVRGLDERAIR
mmetsp:Transcript_39627/g.117911  ORF Transcript_39627/g.117911 Transcript_39627/m.117911 type:complete len:288 (+) Transcript_39627:251-1114(+)